jgi:hypothetical protein
MYNPVRNGGIALPGKQRLYSLEASLPRLIEIMWLADPLLYKILGVIVQEHPSSKKVGGLPAQTGQHGMDQLSSVAVKLVPSKQLNNK